MASDGLKICVLMVRAYMVECRNAGLHFWLLHQVSWRLRLSGGIRDSCLEAAIESKTSC